MPKPTIEPDEKTPDERRREIVRILAAGILRLQKRHALGNSKAKGLDVREEIVLSGDLRKGRSRSKKTSRPSVCTT